MHFINKAQKGLFLNTSWVKKCHFGNFTRDWLIGWIGHALLVQPSITAHRIFFSLFFSFLFYSLNMKPLSEVMPGLLSFRSISKQCAVGQVFAIHCKMYKHRRYNKPLVLHLFHCNWSSN